MFTTLLSLAQTLKTPVNTATEMANFQQSYSQASASFEQIFNHAVVVQSEYGSIYNQVEKITAMNDAIALQQTVTWSSLANADLSQVASELMQHD
jgi:hypothetical protein